MSINKKYLSEWNVALRRKFVPPCNHANRADRIPRVLRRSRNGAHMRRLARRPWAHPVYILDAEIAVTKWLAKYAKRANDDRISVHNRAEHCPLNSGHMLVYSPYDEWEADIEGKIARGKLARKKTWTKEAIGKRENMRRRRGRIFTIVALRTESHFKSTQLSAIARIR